MPSRLTEQAAHEAQIAARLAEGHRSNKAANLVTEDDEDPERIILRTLEEDLLPAFEYKPRYVGHRPWVELFDRALAAATAEHDATSAAANTDEDAEPQHAGSNGADQEAARKPASEVDEAQKPEDVPDEETPHEVTSPEDEAEPFGDMVRRGRTWPAPSPEAGLHADEGAWRRYLQSKDLYMSPELPAPGLRSLCPNAILGDGQRSRCNKTVQIQHLNDLLGATRRGYSSGGFPRPRFLLLFPCLSRKMLSR
ncbi:hypothetical protein [Streptomyces soliscabiei]|uniref:hypothetical protein n=1 Tax=Streptomyces soliscabiei TaxID=588897 RepID=UPI0029A45EAB|nr:hypothetical protein [Streptomyces sp. NY05-11A]MDX2677012.1 hypothetical protein [Streptomyces sp. NY05-11A]